jgi:hypothetical protein
MQNRGQRVLHPRQVARVDPDATVRIAVPRDDDHDEPSARHRRPTIQMSADEIERAVAEIGAPPRRRFARGSAEHEVTPLPVLAQPLVRPRPPIAVDLDLGPDPYPEPELLLLPFRARRPVLATALTAAFAVALLLILHGIIAGG